MEDAASDFRHLLSHVPTSVVIVTGCHSTGPKGMAIGSFTSISLEPRLIGFFPTHTSTSWPAIRECGAFCVNVLARDQEALAGQFARSGGDKFGTLRTRPAPVSGAPIIDGVLAWIECELEREVTLGDHDLVVGRVCAMKVEHDGHPLVFSRNAFPRLVA